jgi:hypothetical protein
LLRLQTENLFARYQTLQKELTHYAKLKRRWNLLNNILHFGRIPVTCGLGLADVALFITGIGAPLAVAGAAVTFGELVGSIAFETFVGIKVKKYNSRIKFIQSWLDKMYLFKCDALMDGRIDSREVCQWRALLEEYDRGPVGAGPEDNPGPTARSALTGDKETKNDQNQWTQVLAQILQRLPPQPL